MLDVMVYPSQQADARLAQIATRKVSHAGEVELRVAEILAAVRREGDGALLRYTRQYDAPDAELADLNAGEAEVTAAYAAVTPDFLDILHRAIDNIRSFHEPQRPQSWFTTRPDGSILGQLVRPVAASGLYIPGGQGGETPLISSVLMNGIPARIAGVEDIALVTPPRRDGSINPHLLVAAREVGVTRVHKLGSAWAIGALAYGTASIKRVDVIVGPGNIYVTLAKKIVAGEVGIDMLAGPSEILVIADEFANPNHVAADLLSQAEHDPMASAVLITTSADLARAVGQCLDDQLTRLPRAETAREALRQYGALFTVERLDDALRLANNLAPEHLELQLRDPWSWLAKVQHAGAVFLGADTPEPVGDYFAGPNHVLPTAGTARFASALGVENFLKRTSVVYYSREAFERDAPAIMRLAELEGLDAHAASVRVRLNRKSI
jgi:histidinol dehydrogenase